MMLTSKYLILIAAIFCCLSAVLAVTCEDEPTNPSCIDCSTDTTNSPDCTTTVAPPVTSPVTTTVAPPVTSTNTTAAPVTGNKKKFRVKNFTFKSRRTIRVNRNSG